MTSPTSISCSTAIISSSATERQLVATPQSSDLVASRGIDTLALADSHAQSRAISPHARVMRGLATSALSPVLGVAAVGAGAMSAGCAAVSVATFGAGTASALTFNTAGAIFFGGTSLWMASVSALAGSLAAAAVVESAVIGACAATDIAQGSWQAYRGTPASGGAQLIPTTQNLPATPIVEEVD